MAKNIFFALNLRKVFQATSKLQCFAKIHFVYLKSWLLLHLYKGSKVSGFCFVFVSALHQNCFLCWDRWNGTWRLGLTWLNYVALGRVLIWVISWIGRGALMCSLDNFPENLVYYFFVLQCYPLFPLVTNTSLLGKICWICLLNNPWSN